MIDVSVGAAGLDLATYNTDTNRATNILSVQTGALEYAPDFGIDLDFFLSPDFKFQTESFKAYCIERLASHGINVTALTESVQSLFTQFNFEVEANSTSTSMVAR